MNPEDMKTAHATQMPVSYKEQYHGLSLIHISEPTRH